jgi:uncharacterized protein (UPF0276 family)
VPVPRFGVGFRSPHFDEIIASPGTVDWLEVVADHFIGVGGPRRARLERLRAAHPMALHGVSLSIASSGALREDYVRGLRALADRIDPVFVSDHLCWTARGGHESHDLLPVAYTREVLAHVAERVARVQDLLGRRLLLENATVYVAFQQDEMDEADFFAELCRRTGCGVLLDVNNLYVNAENLGVDPMRHLTAIPPEAVGYLHLAGHAVLSDVRIDTHDADVPSPVWELFDAVARRFPDAGVIVERDDALPSFAAIAAEAETARARHARARADSTGPKASRAPSPTRPAATAPWRALQDELWSRLVDKPLGFDHARVPGLDTVFRDDTPVRPARGMRVYSDAYTASLRRALAANFPALARVLGAVDFDALAAAYLRAHPPASPDFRSLGATLAEFVRTFAFTADYGVAPGVLADLVALEQASIEVQDAPDEPGPLAPAALATIIPAAWEDARFHFGDAFRIVRVAFEVLPVLEAVARGETPARPAAGAMTYLVCRPDGAVRVERLEPDETAVIEALVAGRAFADACGGRDADAARAGARVVFDTCARGMVVGITQTAHIRD